MNEFQTLARGTLAQAQPTDPLPALHGHAAALLPHLQITLIQTTGTGRRQRTSVLGEACAQAAHRAVARCDDSDGAGSWHVVEPETPGAATGLVRRVDPGNGAGGLYLYAVLSAMQGTIGDGDLQTLDSLCPGLAVAKAAYDAAQMRVQDLVQAEQRLDILEASLPELILRLDAAGNVVFMNAALSRFLGREAATATLEDVFGAPEAERLRTALADSDAEAPEFSTATVMMTGAGVERAVRWTYLRVAAGSRPAEMVAVGRDVTEDRDHLSGLMQRALAAEFENREKSTFLENISHEIRTPLNAIVGLAQVLADDPLSEPQRQMIHTMETAGRQIASILDGIRDFDRLGSGKAQLVYGNFEPAQVIDEAVRLVRGMLDGRKQTLEADLDLTTRLQVRGDRTRVQQVVTNLLVNAVRHAGPARITLSAELTQAPGGSPGLLSVTVADTGRGIGPELRDIIFDRFARGFTGAEDDPAGMGLGLAISSGLCQLHGGELLLQPTDGGGATFIATFEVLDAVDETVRDLGAGRPAAVTASPSASGPGALSLLVAEDNRMNQEVLAAMLKDRPVALSFVENGLKAIEALKTERFAAALIDIRMPLMDGMEFATVFRELVNAGHLPDMPLVACSADPMLGRLPVFREAGFQRALTKPITRLDLLACIDWVKERRDLADAKD